MELGKASQAWPREQHCAPCSPSSPGELRECCEGRNIPPRLTSAFSLLQICAAHGPGMMLEPETCL